MSQSPVKTGSIGTETRVPLHVLTNIDGSEEDEADLDYPCPNTSPWYCIPKRTFDIIASTIAITILSPIMLITALAIKIEDPKGKVFYNAPRGGKNGVPFLCRKYRSMYSNADEIKALLMEKN